MLFSMQQNGRCWAWTPASNPDTAKRSSYCSQAELRSLLINNERIEIHFICEGNGSGECKWSITMSRLMSRDTLSHGNSITWNHLSIFFLFSLILLKVTPTRPRLKDSKCSPVCCLTGLDIKIILADWENSLK